MLTIKKLAGGVAASALLLAMAPAVRAQETTAAVRGEVVSTTGTPVEGAAVTITHLPSGTRSTTTTNAEGVFDARGLRVGGPYEISIESTEYEPEVIRGISLGLGETTRLNFDLDQIAAVEGVVVTAQRRPEEREGVTTTLDQEDIDEVVSITRDLRDLARRSVLTSQNTRGDGGISIAGSNPRTNRITIDGAQAQDEFGLNTGGLPTRRGPISLDAIEQFVIDAVPTGVENGNFLGGALNATLRSGGNEFEGNVFLNYLNDGLVGDSIRGVPVASRISQESYGAFVSGPIWRDRLFFALSYEFFETSESVDRGPEGAGFANTIRGVNQALIDRVVGIFNNDYATEFAVGSIPRTTPLLDEKYSAKLDFNINEDHRVSFTQRYALSELSSRTGLSVSSAGLSSQYYLTGEEDYSYTAELNSDWTDNFSTVVRITHRDLERRQDPPSGQEFAEVNVCLSENNVVSGADTTISCGATSQLTFGPDRFRQANFLETANTALFTRGTYSFRNNLLEFGYEGRKQDIFNIFVPLSDGAYYFDSIADFSAGRANRLEYSNAVTGNANDAAADFAYFIHSLFAQNTFEITDDLRITAGARYDFYRSEDLPALNPNFVARQGFNNQETYDGRSVFMPRASFEYEPRDWLEFRGGFGLFSGGLPNVILSNSFSNTGILSAGVDIQRAANGTFVELTGTPGFTQAIGAAALNINRADPRFGYDIPAVVEQFQRGAIVSPTAETNAISPDFKIPSEWKYFVSAAIQAPEGWASSWAPGFGSRLLDNWRLALDLVYTDVNSSVLFRDLRSRPLMVNGQQQLTPDGRIRYDAIGGTAAQRAALGITSSAPGSTNRDIVTMNTEQGRAYTVGVTLNRSLDNGWDFLLGYAYQDLEDQTSGARFASTASSLYGTGAAGSDPNEEAYGTSFEEVKHRAKFEIGYSRDFVGDLTTRFNLFGEWRTGRPISFLMDQPGSRSATFGVNRDNFLLYVPEFSSDPNPNDLNVGFVTFDSRQTLENLRNAAAFFSLPEGEIVPKGYGQSDNVFLVDLQIAQELPGIRRGHRTRVIFDIQNVLNLLNDEWGVVEEYSDGTRLVSVECATSTGAAAGGNSPACDRYRYSNFNPSAMNETINNDRSLWAVQIRLKYEF